MSRLDQGQTEACPACQADNIDYSIEEFDGVCDSCGFVLRAETNSVRLEWEITNGTFLRSEKRDWLSECRVRNATEQQLAEAFNELEDFADKLCLSDKLRKTTVDIYCNAFRAGLTDGRKTPCFVAACLRLASRQVNRPIPTSRLTGFPNVDSAKFHRSDLVLRDELELESLSPKPVEYGPFLRNQLGLRDEIWEETRRFLNSVEGQQELVGKDPAGIAAGAVYLSQEQSTQQDVAEAVGLSTETIRQRIKQIQEEVDDV